MMTESSSGSEIPVATQSDSANSSSVTPASIAISTEQDPSKSMLPN